MARKLILSAAAATLAFGALAPAYASGGHHRRHHGHYSHHHGHGGKGAAIALGVIGGAIILNELAEDRARDRYYDDRYARDRAYDDGYSAGRRDSSRYDGRYEDDAYYGDDDDYDLAGGPSEYGYDDRGAPSGSSAAAYQTCLDHARRALGDRGFVVSAPYRPDTADDLGGSWRMTATVRAQRGSESWARAMSCEASSSRVYRLELI
ncbi:MAG: hypothetical protein R3C58_02230 [Parvularculaceae bacterium]